LKAMTPDEAIALVGGWPRDKTVPKKLRAAYDKATGEEKWQIGSLSEALMVAAESEEDLALVAKYFG
jgi:hypothetical protein